MSRALLLFLGLSPAACGGGSGGDGTPGGSGAVTSQFPTPLVTTDATSIAVKGSGPSVQGPQPTEYDDVRLVAYVLDTTLDAIFVIDHGSEDRAILSK